MTVDSMGVASKTYRWTFVWCRTCNETPVVLGTRWIKHTDPRPECLLCMLVSIAKSMGMEMVS